MQSYRESDCLKRKDEPLDSACSVLASGSTGNATFVENEKGSLLVDVGLTGKKMEELFSQIDRNIQDLNGI